MIVSKIQGGLGNQMFQYAIGKAYSEKLNTELFLDLSFYNQPFGKDVTPRKFELGLFNLSYQVANSYQLELFQNTSYWYRIKRKLGLPVPIYFREGNDKTILKNKKDIYLDGYWQSELFFKDLSKIIKEGFVFKQSLNEQSEVVAASIISTKTPVAIHLRRGDYVSLSSASVHHGVCDMEYYRSGIRYLNTNVDEPYYFVFSDDVEWAKSNFLPLFSNMEIVQGNHGDDSWQDMHLMSLCKHNIIANSSFSWWAAWLNANPNKIVVAPGKWFATPELNNDIRQRIPTDWLIF
ncbi:MAG: alpha-1,2-fucosyltransferase [Flavipsychrobacter sp.]